MDTQARPFAYSVIRRFMESPEDFKSPEALVSLRSARMVAYTPNFEETSEMIDFGEFSRMELRQQCQYGSRYLTGTIHGYPNLAVGLRVQGDNFNYHSYRMHVDDVPTFLERYKQFEEERWQG